jgi:hypothetical protein
VGQRSGLSKGPTAPASGEQTAKCMGLPMASGWASCSWLFLGGRSLHTQSPASSTSHSWAHLPMPGSRGVGQWGSRGGKGSRDSLRAEDWRDSSLWPSAHCTHAVFSLTQSCTGPGHTLFTSSDLGRQGSELPAPGLPEFPLLNADSAQTPRPQRLGLRRTRISIHQGSHKPLLSLALQRAFVQCLSSLDSLRCYSTHFVDKATES